MLRAANAGRQLYRLAGWWAMQLSSARMGDARPIARELTTLRVVHDASCVTAAGTRGACSSGSASEGEARTSARHDPLQSCTHAQRACHCTRDGRHSALHAPAGSSIMGGSMRLIQTFSLLIDTGTNSPTTSSCDVGVDAQVLPRWQASFGTSRVPTPLLSQRVACPS